MKASIIDQYDKKKYKYRMIKVGIGKGWGLNYLWGTYAPVVDYEIRKGNLYLTLRKPLRREE